MKLCTIFHTLVLSSVTFFGTASRAADAPETADLIIYNAKVITVDSDFSIAQAVAIRGNKIIAVGKDRHLEALKGSTTRMIDAQGRTVMPGLYDSHVFSYQAALSEFNGSLPTLDSIASAQEYIRRQVAAKPPFSWIMLDWLYPTRLKEGRLPTKAELDAVAPNNPVFWNFGSLAVVNSKALQMSGITRETLDPKGGEVVKDPKTLKPTGLLRNATKLLKLPLPPRPPTQPQQLQALKHLYQLYNRQGITSIGEQKADPDTIDLFRDLSRSGQLTVRINCTRVIEPRATTDDTILTLDAMTNCQAGKLPYGPTGVGDDWVRIGPLKTSLDGDILMGTAYLRTPWGIGRTYEINEPSYRGELKQDPYVLPEVFLEAASRGWQISSHCTGDAAMDFLLNCYEQVQFKLDIRERRFLITHANFQAPQNWERCKKLGIAADVQPAFLYRDGASLLRTLGEKRLKYFLPFNTWMTKGLVIGGGSDHMAKLDSLDAMNPWNPWLGIWISVSRETEQGTVINAGEQLTREQAIKLYTINNAYLNFEEKKKGSLEPGKYADLVMIDTDILTCPADDIRNTRVALTMVGGKVVWEARQDVAAR